MGYTNYWYRPATLPKAKWKNFTNELEMLKKNLPEKCITAGNDGSDGGPIIICGWNGKEYNRNASIMQNENEIAFNGEGELKHESFNMSRVIVKEDRHITDKKNALVFGCTKTARKPYDTFVCLALISFKRWFGNSIVVSSDGDREDWEPALELYHSLTKAHLPTWEMLMYNPEDEEEK